MVAGVVGVAIAQVIVGIANQSVDVFSPVSIVGMLTATGLGALILDQTPGHPIGRLCLTIGLSIAIGAALQSAVILVDEPGIDDRTIIGIAAIASTLFTSLAILVAGPILLARFPDGRRSRRLGRLIDLFVLIAMVGLVVGSVRPGLLEYGWILPTHNPLALPVEVALIDALTNAGFLTILVAYLLAALNMGVRYRAGDRTVRAQVRWVAAAAAVNAGAFLLVIVGGVLGWDADWTWSAWAISTGLPILAIGVAVLRYRLYDLDRIISATISYVAVTGILGLLFYGAYLVVLTGASSVTKADGFAVAVSTLVVAATFSPIRRRVQVIVDRRFHRARYDAERTIEALRVRLRDEMEPAAVRGALVEAMVASVEPASVGVWLR